MLVSENVLHVQYAFISDFFSSFLDAKVLERSQSIFEGFIVAGTASKSWFAIFSLLQRLRQACDHVSLTVSKNTSEIASKYSEHAQDESSSNVVGGDGDVSSYLVLRNASNM